MLNHLLRQVVEHCEGGHTDDHPHKPEQPAEQQDGEEHPEAGDPRGIPQDLWSQNVPVKLLQQEHEPHKIQALHRAHQQNKEGAGDRPDKRPEKRDHVGHPHDHAHQHHVGQLHQAHAAEADNADDQGVQELSDDEPAEHPMYVPGLGDDPVGPLQGKYAVHRLLPVDAEGILDVQHVGRHDDPDEDILQDRHQVHHAVGHRGHHVPQVGQDIFIPGCQVGNYVLVDPGLELQARVVEDLRGVRRQLGIVVQKAQKPHLQVVEVAGEGVDNPPYAGDQLGDHDRQQAAHHGEEDRQAHRRGRALARHPGTLLTLYMALQNMLCSPGNPVVDGCQQVGQHRPVDHRHQDLRQKSHPRPDPVHVDHDKDQQNAGGDDQKRGDPPVQVVGKFSISHSVLQNSRFS